MDKWALVFGILLYSLKIGEIRVSFVGLPFLGFIPKKTYRIGNTW